MGVPTQLSDLSATAASNSPAGGDTVGTTMDDYLRAIQSIIVRISAGTDAMATPNIGAATGTSLVLSGLATVNGAFTSLGLDDNATATALTLSGSGANSVTIANSATNPTIGTSAGNLFFNPAAQGNVLLLVSGGASTVNHLQVTGAITGGAVGVSATGSDTDVQLSLSSRGGDSVGIYTNAFAQLQVSINHTASADRYITLTGSNGGNPTIGTSAGNLNLSSAVNCLDNLAVGADDALGAGGVGSKGLFLSSSSIAVIAGSGAPTISAAKGSLYLRSDGTATNNRMYVNTDGATTWTAVTTVA